jgi:hypothetical protein
VKLTVDGKTFSQPLTVKLDPRVKMPPAAIVRMHQLSMQCYNAIARLKGNEAPEARTLARGFLALLHTLEEADALPTAQAAATAAQLNKQLTALLGH